MEYFNTETENKILIVSALTIWHEIDYLLNKKAIALSTVTQYSLTFIELIPFRNSLPFPLC